MNMMQIGTGVLIVLVFSIINWRFCFKSIFVLLVIEGILRKWIMPQAAELLYFLKDGVFCGVFIGFVLSGAKKKYSKKHGSGVTILLYILIVWCFLEVYNPKLGSFLVGMFGTRAYILYIPMLWIMPQVFKTHNELYLFLKKYLLLTIPICILGFFQFFSSPDSILNVYASGQTDVVTFGVLGGAKFARITGPFSYIAGYAVFLSFCFCAIIPLLMEEKSKIWKNIYTLEIALVLVNIFMTGSRGPMVLILLICAGYIVYSRKEVLRLVRKIWIACFLLGAVIVVKLKDVLDAFTDRAQGSDSLVDRIKEGFVGGFPYIEVAGFFGFGVGSAQNGTAALRRILGLPQGATLPPYESETGRIMLELGTIGFLIWFGLRIAIILALFKTYRMLKRPFLKNLALMAFFMNLFTITSQVVTVHSFIPHFWFLVSFIYLLPHYERINNNIGVHA